MKQVELTFNRALKLVLAHEGGYVNHPSDPGGETNYGITKRTAEAHGYMGDMRDIPMVLVSDIYHKSYWLAASCHKLPSTIAFQVFDAAVNHGVSRAIRIMQTCVGTAVDGIVGPNTLMAVSLIAPPVLASRICAERLHLFAGLVHFDQFGRGWTRRIATNLNYIN